MLQAKARRLGRLHRVHLEPGEPGRRLHRADPGATSWPSCARSPATWTFPFDRVLLGGDHLGPFPWQDRDAPDAPWTRRGRRCAHYVAAGFAKIHLDASMRCADDPPGALSDTDGHRADGRPLRGGRGGRRPSAPRTLPFPSTSSAPRCPSPAASRRSRGQLAATRVEDAERTLALTRAAFARARPRSGLGARGGPRRPARRGVRRRHRLRLRPLAQPRP